MKRFLNTFMTALLLVRGASHLGTTALLDR